MKVTVNLPRTPTHVLKNVNCNDSNYLVPFPPSSYSYIEIVQSLQIPKTHEKALIILSKSEKELSSIQQFYSVQQECSHYFNVKIELNTSDFAFSILSESEKVLQELDKLKFADFLSVLKHGYDSLSIKLHSKLNRKIKKYLAESKRDQSEKKQIQQVMNLMKEQSSQQEDSEPIIKRAKPKPAKYVQKKEVQKIVQEVQPEEGQKQGQSQEKPQIKEKSKEQSQLKEQKKKEKRVEKPKNEHHNHRHNQKKKEDNTEEDWEDVKEEKINKRFQKNNKKKHLIYDAQPNKLDVEEDFQDQNKLEDKPKPAFKEQRTKYRGKEKNQGQGKKLFGSSRQKPQRDMRVLLGINGDTDDGWRQRYRVGIVPSFDKKNLSSKSQRSKDNNDNSENNEKNTKQNVGKDESRQGKSVNSQKKQSQQSKKTDNVEEKKSEVVKIESKQKGLSKLFTYPNDGKSFILKAKESYNLLVNNIFWVKLQPNQVIIQKVGPDASGFIRKCQFKSSEDYLVEAEDLVLSFNGMSNLQDGGTKFGNPVIEDFTQNTSQWFKIRSLQIFGYI